MAELVYQKSPFFIRVLMGMHCNFIQSEAHKHTQSRTREKERKIIRTS